MDIAILFSVFLVLLLAGMWIPFAIGAAALLSLWLQSGEFSFRALGLISWGSMENFSLTAVPLFVLMAEIILQSGLSARIYRGLSWLVRRLPGGLLQTNLASCGIFAAISGSSVATAAAIGSVALPQLARRGYDRRLSLGSIAAGGTLGILIPPSVAMIIYGTFTQTSIAKLFVAGIVPGLMLLAFFMLFILGRALIAPASIRSANSAADAEDAEGSLLLTLADLLPFAVLIGTVIGSLYAGWATPTESGAVGVIGALIIALIWARPTAAQLGRALVSAAQITGAVLFIVYAAYIFSYAINMSGLPERLTAWLIDLKLGPIAFILAVFVLYTVLGCIMDSLAMIVITVPLLFPIVLSYGYDPIWFGVALVILIELGQITPPLGLNLFVVQGISGAKLSEVVHGAVPFYAIMLLALAIILIWPATVLWLPSHL
jgi:tripartite ATP-independent transporter DctM subunit